MRRLFGFFLRFFIAFVAAKFILGHLGADAPVYLVGLTALLVANTYLFDFLEYYNQGVWRRLKAGRKAPGKAETEDTLPQVTP
jgi:hypothetical protein